MANLLHIKGSRTQILKTLPSNTMGDDGDLNIYTQATGHDAGGNIRLTCGSHGSVQSFVSMSHPLKMTELSSASADTATQGQIWVKNDNPNSLYYTTGDGDDIQITSGTGLSLGAITGIDCATDFTLDVDGGFFHIKDDGTKHFEFQCDDTTFKIYDDTTHADYFQIAVTTNGATTFVTNDNDGTVVHITLDPDGDLLLQPATYTYSELPIGFTQDEPTFDATDTIVLFSTKGNKAKVTLTDNCTDIHFKFPAVSGNFICVLLQDGTGGRTISNWKTQDSAGNAGAGNSGLVLWAGGSAPSNTETADKADIASFYWDADNEIAYGTYSYNF